MARMGELSRGVVSGARRSSFEALEARARRIASGLAALGVGQGACVAILMRNDIAFMEASYAAQTLGAYAVPVNWHFKAEEIAYILADSAARVLVGHADLLAPIAADLPAGVAVIAVPTPPEVAAAYGVKPASASDVPEAHDYEAWIERQPPHPGPALPATLTMFYTSGTTGHPKGVRRPAPTPQQQVAIERMRRDDLRHRARHPLRRPRAALPLRAQCLRHARGARRRADGPDAALRRRSRCSS